MRRIGIRELRQHASEWIRRVEHGESFEVASRGRAVAWLIPARQNGMLARLEAEGTLEPAARDVLSIAPLADNPGAPSLSSLLDELRADER